MQAALDDCVSGGGDDENIAGSVGILVRAALSSRAGPDRGAPEILVIVPPVILEAGVRAGIFRGWAEKSSRLGRCFAGTTRRQGVSLLDSAPLISSDPLDGIHLTRDQPVILGKAVARPMVVGTNGGTRPTSA